MLPPAALPGIVGHPLFMPRARAEPPRICKSGRFSEPRKFGFNEIRWVIDGDYSSVVHPVFVSGYVIGTGSDCISGSEFGTGSEFISGSEFGIGYEYIDGGFRWGRSGR